MEMIKLLLLLILQINPMVHSYKTFSECMKLSVLKQCPEVNSDTWKTRSNCAKCPEGTKYHCCKNYDSPKSPPNCTQDNYHCVTEKFVEGCAKVKYCMKGEEPVLSFIENQQETNQSTVYCEKCYNINRYNDYPNTSSAEFSECFEKKNICTPEKHKIECVESDSTDERFCRCDARNGYTPYSDPFDHPPLGCSFVNYECQETRKCLKDYTCGDLCKTGFYRPTNSDDCIPYPTTLSTATKKEVTISRNVTTTPPQKTAANVTLAPTGTKSTSTTDTPENNSGSGRDIITWTVVGVFTFIMFYVFWKRKKLLKWCRNQWAIEGNNDDGDGINEDIALMEPNAFNGAIEGNNDDEDGGNEDIALVEPNAFNGAIEGNNDDEDGGNEDIALVEPNAFNGAIEGNNDDEDGGNEDIALVEPNAFNGAIEGNNDDEDGGNEDIALVEPNAFNGAIEGNNDDEDGGNEAIALVEPNAFNGAIEGNNDDESDKDEEDTLSDKTLEEKEEIMNLSINRSQIELVELLDPKLLLDYLTTDLTRVEIRDLKDIKQTSEMTRSLLDKIREKGPKCYKTFKNALKKTKQEQCLKKLLKHEKEACQKIGNRVEDDAENIISQNEN